MRILVVAIGTRGDVQPLLAVAIALQRAGNSVTVVAGRNFRTWISQHGVNFAAALDMESMMRSGDAIAWVENGLNPRVQLRQMRRLLEDNWQGITDPVLEHIPHVDMVLGGLTTGPFLETICAKFAIPLKGLYLQPVRPTRSGPATTQPLFARRYTVANLWMGLVAQWMLWGVVESPVNRLRRRLEMPPHTFITFERAVHELPLIHGYSSHVVPHPADWPPHVTTAGYWFLDEGLDWQPPAPLRAFLDGGAPPVYVGFGSMTTRSPEATGRLIRQALVRAGQRGVVAQGWSGVSQEASDETLFVLDKAPHDWLFPRMAALVHHGGAGTTAAGLRAGKPALVIPHMADQPFWGRRLFELGAGVAPLPRPKLSADRLARSISDLVGDLALAEKAALLGEKIRAEDGVAAAVSLIMAG